jgi:hypothetical protein
MQEEVQVMKKKKNIGKIVLIFSLKNLQGVSTKGVAIYNPFFKKEEGGVEPKIIHLSQKNSAKAKPSEGLNQKKEETSQEKETSPLSPPKPVEPPKPIETKKRWADCYLFFFSHFPASTQPFAR